MALMLIVLSGCSNTAEQDEATVEKETAMRTYESENGPIELPEDPERIVVLDPSAAGAVLLFDGDVVGHEAWIGGSPLFAPYLEGSTEVSVDNLEQVMALEPDLIVISTTNENYEELSQIAPTVAFSYGQLSYLEIIVEYGRMLNKEAEAQAWVETFKEKAQAVGADIKAQHGEDVSISVIEAYGEDLYLFGDNWGRGTQIVYQEMGLAMTDAVKEVALTDGYYSISSEVIPTYAADLIIFSYFEGSNRAFTETDTWQNLDAVKSGNVLMAQAEAFYMTGPITLDYQLEEIEAFFVD